jgi:hypothetical protein
MRWTEKQLAVFQVAARAFEVGSRIPFTDAELRLLQAVSRLPANPAHCAMQIISDAILSQGFFAIKVGMPE